MKEDVKELLLAFHQRNKVKPEAIVVYRDGVSVGEFAGVMVKVRRLDHHFRVALPLRITSAPLLAHHARARGAVLGAWAVSTQSSALFWRRKRRLNPRAVQEYNAIRAACREMGDPSAEYCPPITYLTVLKRHMARLFPGDALSRDNQKGNVKPGVCVDDGIVLRHGFDFYLNSHVGIQARLCAALAPSAALVTPRLDTTCCAGHGQVGALPRAVRRERVRRGRDSDRHLLALLHLLPLHALGVVLPARVLRAPRRRPRPRAAAPRRQ